MGYFDQGQLSSVEMDKEKWMKFVVKEYFICFFELIMSYDSSEGPLKLICKPVKKLS